MSCVPASCFHIWFVSCPRLMWLLINSVPGVVCDYVLTIPGIKSCLFCEISSGLLVTPRCFCESALPCLALPCLALPCLALPCLALPRLASPCLALPRLALPCLALPSLALPSRAEPCRALFWVYVLVSVFLFPPRVCTVTIENSYFTLQYYSFTIFLIKWMHTQWA